MCLKSDSAAFLSLSLSLRLSVSPSLPLCISISIAGSPKPAGQLCEPAVSSLRKASSRLHQLTWMCVQANEEFRTLLRVLLLSLAPNSEGLFLVTCFYLQSCCTRPKLTSTRLQEQNNYLFQPWVLGKIFLTPTFDVSSSSWLFECCNWVRNFIYKILSCYILCYI